MFPCVLLLCSPDGSERHTYTHPRTVWAVKLAGDAAVTGCIDRVVRLVSLASGQLLRELRGHGGEVCSVSACGPVVLSGDESKELRVWSAESGECVATIGHEKEYVRGVALALAAGLIVSLSLYGVAGEVIAWRAK